MADIASELKEFGVFTRKISNTSFHRLPTILSDAREILRNRSEEEVLGAAANIDWIVENYIETVRENYYKDREKFIYDTLDRGPGSYLLSHCLDEEHWNAAAIRDTLDHWPITSNYPNPFIPRVSIEQANKTQTNDILDGALDEFIVSDDPNFENGSHSEYYAVLTIYHAFVADLCFSASRSNRLTDLNDNEMSRQKFNYLLGDTRRTMELGANSALEAMLALTRAQLIRDVESIEDRNWEHIDHRVKTKISMQTAKAAKTKAEKSLKTSDKIQIKSCWEMWQKNPANYKTKAAFSRDMLQKYVNVTSQPVIEEWCRDWEKERERECGN